MDTENTLAPPDGGWGWMVVLGFAIVQTIAMPISHSFGLIFKQRFVNLGLSATDVSVLMNANAAFGMFLGLLNGPLLRAAGFRRVALAGAVLLSTGVLLSATAASFAQLLLTYGVIMSLGVMLLMSSFSTALNTYFKEKLNRATSISMTLAALGPIFFPYFITGLMSRYGVFGCVLILGAISTHTIMAALLLQPVEWHMKKTPTPRVTNKTDHNARALKESNNVPTPTSPPTSTLDSNARRDNHLPPAESNQSNRLWRLSIAVIKFLDLDILKEPDVRYVILGMVAAIFVEINFAQMVPLALADLSFTTGEIASVMTLMSGVDIVGRFTSPFVEERFKIGAKNMFLGGIASMVVIRTGLLYAETYYEVLFVSVFLGLIKGVSAVYMHLMLPSCLPVEKLPAAGGVLMLGCGMFLMVFGPLMGMLRDYTGSYSQGIMALNALSVALIMFWTSRKTKTVKPLSKQQ